MKSIKDIQKQMNKRKYLEHIQYLRKFYNNKPRTIQNLIDYWYDRIDRLKIDTKAEIL